MRADPVEIQTSRAGPKRTNGGNGWLAPTPPHDDIVRSRLDVVYAQSAGRLVRVLAPSGYGKTSLAARWMASERRCVRWVDLSWGDDDPVALFGTLRGALAGLVAIPNPTTAHAGPVDPYVRALEEGLTGLGREPAAEPFVLVLDDVHRVGNAVGNWLIETVVDHLPKESTVLLLGRGHHDRGAIGRFRLAPGLVDVDVDDLAFDESECRRLLGSMGVDTRSPEVADVLKVLEGWPAGVRLAGEVLRSGTRPSDIADHVNLVDYLRGEWVGQLDGHELTFLREVACLREFTGDKCDDVLQRTGSAELLRRLHRDRVVVFALDQRGEWYRLHGLLVRWLSAELRSLDAVRWTQIHLRAARYWERRGDIDRAVSHARVVNDLDVLEELILTHGGGYLTTGHDATVERWLDAFPIDHVRSSPGLVGLRAVQCLQRGDEHGVVQWMRVLDQAIRDVGGPSEDPTTWWGVVLHAALDERPAIELIPSVAAAREHLAGGPWSGFAGLVHGALSFLAGDLDTARSALADGAFDAEAAGNATVIAQCLAVTAIIDDCQGRHVESAALARRAAETVGSCGAELLPTTAPSMAVSALRHARRNEPELAARGVTAARRALVGFRSLTPWFNVVTRLAIVRTALLLDDRETAQSVMLELEHHARVETLETGRGDLSAIDVLVDLRGQVEVMHRPSTGSMALTGAELRVLRLLQTNLSLADIAAELYVSRNTVKTHTAAIYRKLGAAKRNEAVSRARSAGLLASSENV